MRLVTPITDYIPKSILTTQGDMVVRDASGPTRLAAVAAGDYLKSAGVGTVPVWADAFAFLTTQGDMLVRDASGPARLAAVAANQYLKSAGVGAEPAYSNLRLDDTGLYLGYGARSTAGSHAITGAGFEPSAIIMMVSDFTNANINDSWAFGFVGANNYGYLHLYDDGVNQDSGNNIIAYVRRDASNYLSATLTSFDADGVTLNWSLTGTCACNYRFLLFP